MYVWFASNSPSGIIGTDTAPVMPVEDLTQVQCVSQEKKKVSEV